MAVTVYAKVKKRILSNSQYTKILEFVLASLGKRRADISVHTIGDARMRTLNRLHRGKDKTTDVLSFPTEDPMFEDVGDIFISLPQIRRQAKRFGVTIKEECVRMLVHGTLHLFGYDHVTKKQAAEMFSLQEELVEKARKKKLFV
jgi:rRNA maturation RNase YbeY